MDFDGNILQFGNLRGPNFVYKYHNFNLRKLETFPSKFFFFSKNCCSAENYSYLHMQLTFICYNNQDFRSIAMIFFEGRIWQISGGMLFIMVPIYCWNESTNHIWTGFSRTTFRRHSPFDHHAIIFLITAENLTHNLRKWGKTVQPYGYPIETIELIGNLNS